MSLFATLLTAANRRKKRAAKPVIAPIEGETKTANLLRILQSGPQTTAALAVKMELQTRNIWGLLRVPRDAGKVRYEDGDWTFVADYPRHDLIAAEKLLRKHGYTVLRPGEYA